MEPTHLLSEELIYELKLRGEENVESLHARGQSGRLRQLMMEGQGEAEDKLKNAASPYPRETDIVACRNILGEIRKALMSDLSEGNAPELVSRNIHLIDRLQRILLYHDDTESVQISAMIVEAKETHEKLTAYCLQRQQTGARRKTPITYTENIPAPSITTIEEDVQAAFARSTMVKRSPICHTSTANPYANNPTINATRSYLSTTENNGVSINLNPIYSQTPINLNANDCPSSQVGNTSLEDSRISGFSASSPNTAANNVHEQHNQWLVNQSLLNVSALPHTPPNYFGTTTSATQLNTLHQVQPNTTGIAYYNAITTPSFGFENNQVRVSTYAPITHSYQFTPVVSNVYPPTVPHTYTQVPTHTTMYGTTPPIPIPPPSQHQFISKGTDLPMFPWVNTNNTVSREVAQSLLQAEREMLIAMEKYRVLMIQTTPSALSYTVSPNIYTQAVPSTSNVLPDLTIYAPLAPITTYSSAPTKLSTVRQPTTNSWQPVYAPDPQPRIYDSTMQRREADGTLNLTQGKLRVIPIEKWKVIFSNDMPLRENEYGLHQWIEKVEIFAKSNGIDLDEVSLKVAHMLSGSAANWYPEVHGSIQGWTDLVEKMRKKFLNKSYQYEMINQINDRKQKPTESVLAYISDIKSMFRALPRPELEERIIFTIRSNMREEIRNKFSHETCESMDMLEEYARNAELSLPKMTTKEKTNRYQWPRRRTEINECAPVNNSTSNSDSDDSESDKTVNEIRKFIQRYDRGRDSKKGGKENRQRRTRSPKKKGASEGNDKPLRCFNCKETGHLFIDCNRAVERKFCFRCGYEDVIAPECPNCNTPKNSNTGSH